MIIIFSILAIYLINDYLGLTDIPNTVFSKIDSFTLTVILPIDNKKIFEVMAKVEDYPKILPENYISVTIINKTNNIVFTEEEITQYGMNAKLLVKHTIIPYENHTIQVIDGISSGTNITIVYKDMATSTKLTTDVNFSKEGIPFPLRISSKSNLEHAMNTVLEKFVDYAKHMN